MTTRPADIKIIQNGMNKFEMNSATHKPTAGSRSYRKSKLEPVNCYADASFGSKLDKKIYNGGKNVLKTFRDVFYSRTNVFLIFMIL